MISIPAFMALGLWYVFYQRDLINLTGMTGGDSPVVLLDGWRSACDVNDETYRVVPSRVGNMKTRAGCASEIVAFAIDNAMAMATEIVSWTDSRGDVVTVAMTPKLQVPVTVWTLSGLPSDATINLSRADAVYNGMQAGISFTPTINDYHTQSRFQTVRCDTAGPMLAAYPPTSGRINVYYVPNVEYLPPTGSAYVVTGRWCKDNPNIILIGAFAEETLAHELGHAFALEHSDAWAPWFPPPDQQKNNLMISWSVPRGTLTTGQVFRVNVNELSRLNKNLVRNGLTRTCPDSQTTSAPCPAIDFDVNPK